MRVSRGSRLSLVLAAVIAAASLAPAHGSTAPSLTGKARSKCTMYFIASVRTGPNAGADYEGVLKMKLDSRGRFRSGTFSSLQGGRVKVTSSSRGRAIGFSLPTRDGTVTGRGTVNGSLSQCVGSMEGGLKGPGRRDRGDWLATTGDLLRLPGGVFLFTEGESNANNPKLHVIFRKADFAAEATVFAGALNTPGNLDGPRLAARFNKPSGMAHDAARSLVYIADVANASIRRLNQSGGQVTTILRSSDAAAAALAAGFSGVTGWEPHGVAVDNAGNLLITDAGNHVIWRYNPTTLQLKLFAGRPGSPGTADGSDTAARFSGPQQIGVRTSGVLTVSDALSRRVRLRSTDGVWSTLALSPQ